MKNPDSLSLEKITNEDTRIAINFYNNGKLPENSRLSLGEGQWVKGYSIRHALEELRCLHPDRVNIVSCMMEPTMMAVVECHGGYIIFAESLRNRYIINRWIIPPQEQPSSAAILSQFEKPFSVLVGDKMVDFIFPVLVLEDQDIKSIKSALVDFSVRHRGVLLYQPSEESLPLYRALAAPHWNS